jgi:predicted DNA-binding transcriptional regulator YafY
MLARAEQQEALPAASSFEVPNLTPAQLRQVATYCRALHAHRRRLVAVLRLPLEARRRIRELVEQRGAPQARYERRGPPRAAHELRRLHGGAGVEVARVAAALEDAAQSAILKLSSIGVPADPIDIPGLSPKLSNSSTDLVVVTDAIAHSNFLHFDYLSPNLEAQERTIVPIALSNRSGFWYVSGVDQEIQEVRTFRLDRIIGAIEVLKNKSAFEFPADFDFDLVNVTAPNRLAVIDVRKGKGHALRTLSESTKDLGEWDQIKVPIHSIQTLAAEILWHGEDVFVHQPTDLREYIVEQLQALVANHE